jgi:hypothetical protein
VALVRIRTAAEDQANPLKAESVALTAAVAAVDAEVVEAPVVVRVTAAAGLALLSTRSKLLTVGAETTATLS